MEYLLTNPCSHNQLFHLRTISLSDEMPKTRKYDVLGRATTMLEPLQQWEFPSNIIDLSVHPARHVIAYISCRNGNIYQWTAEVYKGSGASRWNGITCVFHAPHGLLQKSRDNFEWVGYSLFKEELYSRASSLSALCHHTVSPIICSLVMLPVVSLLDNRYPKRYVQVREVATDINL